MPKPSPREIYCLLKDGELSKGAAIEFLVTYVKNSENLKERTTSIEILNQLNIKDNNLYTFFEEMLVSETRLKIRAIAAEIIIKNYFDRGLNSIKWILEHYNSPYLLSSVLHSLLEHKHDFLRTYLVAKLDDFIIGKINKVKHKFDNFFSGILDDYYNLFEIKSIKWLPTDHLVDIIINVNTLIFIEVNYNLPSDLGYFIKDGYVLELDIDVYRDLNWKRLSDIEGIFNFTRLEQLTINRGIIEDLEGIEKFINLKHLSLLGNVIREIKSIDKLYNLESLSLIGNSITEITGLDYFPNLKHLNLSSNKIREIKNLDNSKELELLCLEFNKIKEIKGLENLTNLKYLYLNGNQISEIRGLDKLVNLESLHLQENRIKRVEGIDKLKKLHELHLDRNMVKILENLERLDSLRVVSFVSNKISEVRGIEKINQQIVISLYGNNLSNKTSQEITKLIKQKKTMKIYF